MIRKPWRKNKTQRNKIKVENPYQNQDIDGSGIQRFAGKIINAEASQKPWTINIVIVAPKDIVELNKKFLNRAYITDVITFNLSENFDPFYTGELYICHDRVREQAQEYKTDPRTELFRVVAHGIYHLLGYNDESPSEKKAMTQLENDALLRFVM